MRKLYLLSASLLLSSACATANDSIELSFLETKITEYEVVLADCMTQGSEATLPDDPVIDALRGYPERDVDVFLIAHATEMEDKCATPQLGNLAIALQLASASADAGEAVDALIKETNEIVFSNARWELKRQYLGLPEAMKNHLITYPAFQAPFNTILIRDHLAKQR